MTTTFNKGVIGDGNNPDKRMAEKDWCD